jgi:hypothetical protein
LQVPKLAHPLPPSLGLDYLRDPQQAQIEKFI